MLNKQIDNSLKGGEPTPDVCAQPTTPADLAKFTFLNNGKGMLKKLSQAADSSARSSSCYGDHFRSNSSSNFLIFYSAQATERAAIVLQNNYKT